MSAKQMVMAAGLLLLYTVGLIILSQTAVIVDADSPLYFSVLVACILGFVLAWAGLRRAKRLPEGPGRMPLVSYGLMIAFTLFFLSYGFNLIIRLQEL